MDAYTYEGYVVRTVRGTEAKNDFLPGGKFSSLVQQVISGIDPWDGYLNLPHKESAEFPGYLFYSQIVRTDEPPDYWARYVRHRAAKPGLTPFVRVPSANPPRTSILSVELIGTVDEPILVRVYSGSEYLPLPWMASAHGQREESIEFWRHHAMADDGSRIIVPGTKRSEPPAWF